MLEQFGKQETAQTIKEFLTNIHREQFMNVKPDPSVPSNRTVVAPEACEVVALISFTSPGVPATAAKLPDIPRIEAFLIPMLFLQQFRHVYNYWTG